MENYLILDRIAGMFHSYVANAFLCDTNRTLGVCVRACVRLLRAFAISTDTHTYVCNRLNIGEM